MTHQSTPTLRRRACLVTAAALLLCSQPLFAQQGTASAKRSPWQATGILCDSLTHDPQAYATIRLLTGKGADKPVRVVTTTTDGHFTIAAPQAGTYTLEAIVTGMQPLRREITFSDARRTIACDTLYIKEYSNTLSSATVTATKPLVKAEIDKLTYSVADDPDAQTSSVLELLRKVPMVTVDGEDNIKVNGNSSFKVYVNGKPNQMMSQNPSLIFKTYPASAIKKIEVITNPGAKYDAEGTAGVLNIITATETRTKGYVVTPSIGASNRGYDANVFAMGQLGKFTFSLNYGLGSQKSPKDNQTTSERVNFAEPDMHTIYTTELSNNDGVYQFGNLDASYELSPKDLFSISAGLRSWKSDNDGTGSTRVTREDGSLYYSYDRLTAGDNNFKGFDTSADYQHSFSDDRRLTLSYRYNLSPGNNTTDASYQNVVNIPEQLELTDLKSDPDRLSYEHTAQADFTTNLDTAKVHTLSMGLKYIYRINRSNSREWSRPYGTGADFVLDDARSLYYRHRGDIGAAYLEYNLKKNAWSLMAGSRYELYRASVTYPDGKRDAFHTTLSDWVPSLSAGYSLSPTQMVKAGYNLRISRPDIYYLSPYVDRTDPQNISYGDPSLGSARAHNFELSYSTFAARFTLNASLNYSFTNNDFASYTFIDKGIANTTYAGIQHSKTTTLSVFMNWTIVPGTVFNLNAEGLYSDVKARNAYINAHNSGFSGGAWGGLTQNLPWKIKANLWLGGNARGIDLQGRGTSFYFYSLSFSRSFLKDDRLTVSLRGNNFFGRYQRFGVDVATEQFRNISRTRVDMMHVGFSIRYRIGKLNTQVRKAERTITNDDLRSGGDQGGQQGGQQGGM